MVGGIEPASLIGEVGCSLRSIIVGTPDRAEQASEDNFTLTIMYASESLWVLARDIRITSLSSFINGFDIYTKQG